MQLQTRNGALRPPGERRSTMSTPTKTRTTGNAGQWRVTEADDAPNCQMTRHASPTASRSVHGKAGTHSGRPSQADRERNH